MSLILETMEALVIDDRTEQERQNPDFDQPLDLTRLQLYLRTISIPQPSQGEVLVQVYYSPINPSDLVFIKGQYAISPKPPQVAGFECSGIVIAHGGGYKAWKLLNKKVICRVLKGGAWGQFVIVKTDFIVPLPNNADLQSMCGLINPLTVYSFVEMIKEGKHLAIAQTAAASACGKMLFKWCLVNDIPIINIVRRDEQVAQLKALGSQFTLNSNDVNFENELETLCQQLNVTISFDCVSGALTGKLLNAMVNNSTVIVYGILARENATGISPKMIARKNQQIKGYLLEQYVAQKSRYQRRKFYQKAAQLMTDVFKIDVSQSFDFRNFQQARDFYLKNRSEGKVVLEFSNQKDFIQMDDSFEEYDRVYVAQLKTIYSNLKVLLWSFGVVQLGLPLLLMVQANYEGYFSIASLIIGIGYIGLYHYKRDVVWAYMFCVFIITLGNLCIIIINKKIFAILTVISLTALNLMQLFLLYRYIQLTWNYNDEKIKEILLLKDSEVMATSLNNL